MDIMATIAAIPGVGPFLPYLALAMAIAALVAMALPPPAASSGTLYRTVYSLVNLLAANKGHAANANAPTTGATP